MALPSFSRSKSDGFNGSFRLSRPSFSYGKSDGFNGSFRLSRPSLSRSSSSGLSTPPLRRRTFSLPGRKIPLPLDRLKALCRGSILTEQDIFETSIKDRSELLIIACERKKYNIATMLLDRGVFNINEALECACEYNALDIVEYIICLDKTSLYYSGALTIDTFSDALIISTNKGYLELTKKILNDGTIDDAVLDDCFNRALYENKTEIALCIKQKRKNDFLA